MILSWAAAQFNSSLRIFFFPVHTSPGVCNPSVVVVIEVVSNDIVNWCILRGFSESTGCIKKNHPL